MSGGVEGAACERPAERARRRSGRSRGASAGRASSFSRSARGFSNLRGNFRACRSTRSFGMAAVILLIALRQRREPAACARASARRREIAVRPSLGASHDRALDPPAADREAALLAAAVVRPRGCLDRRHGPPTCSRGRAIGGAAPVRRGTTSTPASSCRRRRFRAADRRPSLGLAAGAAEHHQRAPAGLPCISHRRASPPRSRGRRSCSSPRRVALSAGARRRAAGLFVQTLRNYSRVNLGFSQERVATAPLQPRQRRDIPRERLERGCRARSSSGSVGAGRHQRKRAAMCALVAGCRS